MLKKNLLIALFLIALAYAGSAQNQTLSIRTNINTAGKTIKQVIAEIEKDYQVDFSYSDNLLPKKRLNEIDNGESLGQFLDNLLTQHSIGFKLIDNQIVLFHSPQKAKQYYLTGYITDSKNSESIVNGAIYVADIGVGTISNNYGYFSILLTEGRHHLRTNSLGYLTADTVIDISRDTVCQIKLVPVSYQMNEIIVTDQNRDDFIASAMNSIAKIDIEKLKQMPNVLGEHDALRNLDMLSGMQMSEFSTSNICVRGGAGDQTLFLMDEANIYNASHFGGFASVFNPDVVKHINIHKNELPTSETGALSSIIDVRLRDGDMQQWHTKGSIGLLTARLLVEGPLKKDKSSLLVAVRRTFADQIAKPIMNAINFKLSFYYFDSNIKFNYKFNPRNRIYWSWYTGGDHLDHSMYLKRINHISTLRWNHIFGDNLFCNTSVIGSFNRTDLLNFHYNGAFSWRSICWDTKAKIDFTHHVNDIVNLKYGWQTTFYSLEPFDLTPDDENISFKDSRIHAQPIYNHGIYIDQTYNIGARLTMDAGFRMNSHSGPTDHTNAKDSTIFYPEWNLTACYRPSENMLIKLNSSLKYQTIHQMQISSYGITVNRWMPANSRFMPEQSLNMSVSANYKATDWMNVSANIYQRRLKNLIETLQEVRLLYEINPERFAHNSSVKVHGCELTASITTDKLMMTATYDYTNSRWLTNGLNNDESYPASFIRKHSVIISGTYHINNRMRVSTAWQIASGLPYTAAVGKYIIDGKTVMQFDNNKINTEHLPNYNRLDVSLDIDSKKNPSRKWNGYWNISVYNLYARKNPLGVSYFTTNNLGQVELNPGYYYFYQFVPSVSYRFEF